MAIKYISSWPINADEALVNFQFLEDRGAYAQAKVNLGRSVLSLSEEEQAQEAEKRFREIHMADIVTDERLHKQGEMVEITSKALMELVMTMSGLQSQINTLNSRINELETPEEETPEKEAPTDEEKPNEKTNNEI